jgi:hypothetical protein
MLKTDKEKNTMNPPKNYNSKYVAISLILSGVLAGTQACTGPFGLVVGPESTHNAYNRRIAVERQYVHGNQLTERDRQELNELLAEVK